MSESTNDDKIQQLVRSVLEAVDARLAGVRAEMSAAANDVQHRHAQLLDTIVALQQRVDTGARQREAQDATIASFRAELDRLKAMPPAPPAPTTHAPAPATTTAPEPTMPTPTPPMDLSQFTRPLMADGYHTAPIPLVAMIEPVSPNDAAPQHALEHHDVLVDLDERRDVAWAAASADAQADSEMIDLERLARLLGDKLDHLELPKPQ
ncbi:MAG: hypothetical protein WCI22_08860 [Actinomycetota bacterium]